MIFVIFGFFTLLGLLYSEYSQNRRLKWIFKPATSLLFLATALSGGPESSYDWLILAGLIGGFLGDVFLIVQDQRWFLAGLVVFLLGHILYVFAFNSLIGVAELSPVLLIAIAFFSAGFYGWLSPHLGDMKMPVFAYVLVITAMVWSAWAVFFETDLKDSFRTLVAVGATCFYASDMAVAIDRFRQPAFNNAFWGLPLYYAGQFMLALSVGMV